jgi:hypothetical protein
MFKVEKFLYLKIYFTILMNKFLPFLKKDHLSLSKLKILMFNRFQDNNNQVVEIEMFNQVFLLLIIKILINAISNQTSPLNQTHNNNLKIHLHPISHKILVVFYLHHHQITHLLINHLLIKMLTKANLGRINKDKIK